MYSFKHWNKDLIGDIIEMHISKMQMYIWVISKINLSYANLFQILLLYSFKFSLWFVFS